MSYAPSSNPFYTENDKDDDYSFGNRNEESNSVEDRRYRMQEQVGISENRQLESTKRALAAIHESNAMGVETAEELMRQGEQLDNIEKRTDEISSTLTASQKHLNNIKSVFGGIKNWWGNKKSEPNNTQSKPTEQQSRLMQTVEKSKPDVQGFYEDNDLDEKFLSYGNSKRENSYSSSIRDNNFSAPSKKFAAQKVSNTAREREVNENLDMMSDGMSSLKNLALDLGGEIERQNTQLDRIQPKVDVATSGVDHQNRQIRNILRK